MASMRLGQSRALAGSKAMTMVSRSQTVKPVSNGSKYFMKRDGSFMVEVTVNEGESEDQAVKRYMRAVVQSGVLNKLRNRRYKESRIELEKRRLAEKAQARKLGIEEPTWEEFYGDIMEEARPFDEFFTKLGEDEEALLEGSLPTLAGDGDAYYAGEMYDLSNYDNTAGGANTQGGYINDGQYQQQQQQQQGGYMGGGQQQQQQQPRYQQY